MYVCIHFLLSSIRSALLQKFACIPCSLPTCLSVQALDATSEAVLPLHFTLSYVSFTCADSSFKSSFVLSDHLHSSFPRGLILSTTISIAWRVIRHLFPLRTC